MGKNKISDSDAHRRVKPAHIRGMIKEKIIGEARGIKAELTQIVPIRTTVTDTDHRQVNSINNLYR
jgi:hypothetical protein